MAKLVCGCGYLGMRVAQRWLTRGETVWATTRSPERAREFLAAGLRPVVVDLTRPWTLPRDAAGVETVLFALGFDRTPGQSLEQVYRDGLAHTAAACSAAWRRFVYISSTGVYGQTHGEWVDEDSPCNPTRAGGRACLAAEQWLARSPLRDRVIVLRLAGIYGPGRIPKQTAVERGERIEAVESACLNLIHVDDAAEVVLAAEDRVMPPRTLAVADGCPVSRGEFYRELARLLGAPPPTFLDDPATLPLSERGASDKRVSNARLLEILSAGLRYPTFREGLAAIVAGTAG